MSTSREPQWHAEQLPEAVIATHLRSGESPSPKMDFYSVGQDTGDTDLLWDKEENET